MNDKLDQEVILNQEDLLNMLDSLLEKWDEEWWNEFYSDKGKPIPFFVNAPDENLVTYFDKYFDDIGRALDVGCGNGRNSRFIASRGYDVEGLDFSKKSIEWAKEESKKTGDIALYVNDSFFNINRELSSYDLIYDSGCLHHIKPHRRSQYLEKVHRLLKPGGYFGLVCFNLKGGANLSDHDVYKKSSMAGGLGYSDIKLKKILGTYFEIVEFREMRECADNALYGKDICWSILMRRLAK
ncbi:Methyltransferase type 11 [Alkaliphilus metalliredigens QYMF]|uniref:Methyltransferase type 11 n=1 Tax=Alkaliphilus metalliredigens (strain QYMF) TaxID=293826 RepID=A6TP14_ALKMQ|nr:class I SAM-dependent methyltransferase [Alkaliphilus metalliredigens]ABR47932.1 Methyltransferase type 11 [Alkaliphilus metalliredigens QYMF]